MSSVSRRLDAFSSIETLVPHRTPMLLIDRLLNRAADTVTVAVKPRQSSLFANADGTIPAYVGMEYMAQAIAAFAGVELREQGRPISVGFLLGARAYNAHVEHFLPDTELVVEARQLLRDETNLVLFDCAIFDGEVCVADAQIKAIAPSNLSPMIDELAQMALV